MPRVVPFIRSIQYDGTNGAYIAGVWATGVSLVSDTGTVLTALGDGQYQTVNLGEWVVTSYPGTPELQVMTEQQYADRYYELPE
jgi:hypothetical protein